jgi:serine/threonine protein kinase
MQAQSLDFKLREEIREGLTEEALKALFASMEVKTFKPGDRLITRGEKGDRLFVIQDGTCSVIIEKDGKAYPIVSLKSGDLAGEMALITGEPRSAHVDAETAVVALEIGRERFDAICEEHRSLREILSKIVQENIYSSIFEEHREVGKYNIKEIVGKGSLSTVYKGMHRHLNMPVAIKVLQHDMAMNPDFLDKFKEDAKKIVQLNHDNIVKVFDIVGLYRTIFIFMEYLEGESLQTILHRTPQLPLNSIVDILLQICSGLAFSHEQALIPQNVKPSNVFVLRDDQVKLIDFALAYPAGAVDASLGETVLHYMSPEQMDGKPLDERTDIYSLGITAFEMLTGSRPFAGEDIHRFLETHATLEIPDPRSLRSDLPDELCQLVIKASQKAPDKRYGRVEEIMKELEPLAGKWEA